MYHVIAICSTAILFYFISYSFSKIGYFSLQLHKKLWNLLLATAFLTTALLGLFMALQINYKWEIPFIKSVLKWHVEVGIGLAITGIIHFIWHLSYFRKMFSRSAPTIATPDNEKMTTDNIRTNLFVTGFVSTSIQLLFLREIMNIAGGYELVTGIFLCSWLLGSAIGSAIAGKSSLIDIKKINLFFSFSPLISLIIMLFLSRLFLNTGETPSFLVSIIFTFLVLIPFCLVSGFTFVRLISLARAAYNISPGKSFSIETLGGILSGILVSLLTAGMLNTYQLLMLIILLSIAYTLLTFYLETHWEKIIAKIIIILITSVIIITNPDIFFRQMLMPGIKVTGSKDTPYGNITNGNYRGESSIYYNQRLLAYNNDVIEREEDIHYAVLQVTDPKEIILVSGSLQNHITEILKYPFRKVIYIERDPALVQSEKSSSYNFPGELVITNTDALSYIKNTPKSADVIILLTPPPSTLLINRYYTTEFFSEVKKKLNTNGVFMCSPGPGDNYFNKGSLNLYSSIFNSLNSVFENVKPVLGNKLYFIASDSRLSVSFCHLSEKKKIENIYVSSDFLSDDLIIKKSDEIISLINHNIKQNRSAFPVACLYYQSYNFSKYINEKIPSIIIMFLIFVIPVLLIKRRNMVMYFTASALAGFEIILLLTLQLIIGNMYQLTGLVIAGIMTGLAVGAGSKFKLLNSISLEFKTISLFSFYAIIGLFYNYFLTLKNGFPAVVIIIAVAFFPAFITGTIFNELTIKKVKSVIPAAVYSADLLGSSFGFLIISGFTIPLFGIRLSVFLLSALVLAGFLFGTIRNKL